MGRVLCIQGQTDTSWVVTSANTTQYLQCGAIGALEAPVSSANEQGRGGILQKNAGVFSGLNVSLTANGVAAVSTARFRINGVNGNMLISIPSSSTGNFTETASAGTYHTDAVIAGDITSLQTTPGASTGTLTFTAISVLFLNTSSADTIARLGLADSTYDLTATSTTYYEPIAGENCSTPQTAEANAKCRIRKAGTIDSAAIHVRTNGRSSATVITLRKNAADTGITISVAAGATGWKEETSPTTASVVAGDDVDWSIALGTGTGTFSYSVILCDYVNTTGWFPLVSSGADAAGITDATTAYVNLAGYCGLTNATITNVDAIPGATFNFAELTALVTANDVSSASSVTLMNGATATTLTAPITASTTGLFPDSTHTVTTSQNDLLSLRITIPSISGVHSVTIKNVLMWGQEISRFYFHAANTGVTGTLPTTEQSSLTSAKDVDAQTVNRSMTDKIGTSQTSITLTSLANTSTNSYYFTKFVSDPIKGVNIAANTWNYAFAVNESSLSANLPVGASSTAIPINCYVWRPSNGTKVGTILNGNSAAVFAEASTATTEKAMYGSFTGSAVTGVTDGDVIVFEVWFTVTQAIATAFTDIYYFDGTTVNTVINTTVSNYASYIETPQFIFPFIAGALTRVLASDTLKYHIVGRVIQDNILVYNVRKQVLQSDTLVYNLRKQILHSNTLKYNLIGRIKHANTLKYNLIGRVVHSDTLRYNVWKQILHANTLRYNLWKQVKKADTLRYNLAARIVHANTLKYNVWKQVLHSNTLLYNLRKQILHSNTLKYNVWKQIKHANTLKYNLIGRILHSQTLKYNLIGRVIHQNTLRYNLIGRIVHANTLKYNIVGRIVHANTLKYNLLKQVLHSNTLKYNVWKQVVHANTLLWNLVANLARITNQNTLKYNIIQRQIHANTIKYNIKLQVKHANTLRYNLLKQILHANTLRYNLIGRILHANTLKYNVWKQVKHANTLKYNLLGRITHANTLIYNILVSAGRHIELTITEANIKLSDTFYKTRTITEYNINIGDSVNAEKTDNTPVNITKTLNENNITMGSGTLSRIVSKVRQLIENISIGADSAAITRRNKVRTITDNIPMGDSVTAEKSQRHIEKSLSDNISLGDSVSRQTNKSRRIGGPG